MKPNWWITVGLGLVFTLNVAAQNLTLVKVGTPPKSVVLPYNGTAYTVNLSSLWAFQNITDPVVQVNVQQLTLKAGSKGSTVDFKSLGGIDMELFPAVAPNTTANFLDYVSSGNYGVSFLHRSVPGFIIQGGAYKLAQNTTTGAFTGQLEAVPTMPPIASEFNMSNVQGTVAMALTSGNVDSATSQWFINLVNNNTTLDPQGFTVFGKVINNSMTLVNQLANAPVVNNGGALSQLPVIAYSAGNGTITKITPSGNASVQYPQPDNYPQGYSFQTPTGLAFDANNTLWVLENGSGSLYEVMNDTVEPVISGEFSSPQAIAIDANGTMFVTDPDLVTATNATTGNTTAEGVVAIVFPDGSAGVYADLDNTPIGVVVDANDTVYATEYGNGTANGTVEKITPTTALTEENLEFSVGNFTVGNVTTLASGLTAPVGLAEDAKGNLYVSSYLAKGTISKITPEGNVSLFASGFDYPRSLSFDANGNLYVANYGNGEISKVTPQGKVSVFSEGHTPDPLGLAFDSGGNLDVSDGENVQLENLVYTTYTQLPFFGATVNPTGVVKLSSNSFGQLQLTPIPGASGKLTLAITANDGNKKTYTAKIPVIVGVPEITVQPASPPPVAEGGSVKLMVEASDLSKLNMTYKWYMNGKALANSTKPTVISGVTTNMLQLSNVQPAAAGNYTVVVGNLLGTTTSSAATVVVTTP
ncbi:MAG: peptidylprolyl isomerase [Opitutales bacterium]|jgi:peptidyl-prolyl cis-trans isomerase A (cyclophilin A)